MSKKDMLNFLNGLSTSSLIKTLNIEYSEIGENYLVAKMPVNSSVYQPDGILHGGATAALAETVGSTATRIFSNGNNVLFRLTIQIRFVLCKIK